MLGLVRPQRGTIEAFGAPRPTESGVFRGAGPRRSPVSDSDDQLFSPTVIEDVAFGPLNFGRTPRRKRARSPMETLVAARARRLRRPRHPQAVGRPAPSRRARHRARHEPPGAAARRAERRPRRPRRRAADRDSRSLAAGVGSSFPTTRTSSPGRPRAAAGWKMACSTRASAPRSFTPRAIRATAAGWRCRSRRSDGRPWR